MPRFLVSQRKHTEHMVPSLLLLFLVECFGDVSIDGEHVPYGRLLIVGAWLFVAIGFYGVLLMSRIPVQSSQVRIRFLYRFFSTHVYILRIGLFLGRAALVSALEAMYLMFLVTRFFPMGWETMRGLGLGSVPVLLVLHLVFGWKDLMTSAQVGPV